MDYSNENENSKSIQVAVQWWADRLTGIVRDIRLSEDDIAMIELTRAISPKTADHVELDLKIRRQKSVEANYLFPLERKRFESELETFITKEIETRHVAYLYVGKNGAEGGLACVAEKCEIEFGEQSVFSFAPHVEMFVERNKVEVRYGENMPLETIYDCQKQILETQEKTKRDFVKGK